MPYITIHQSPIYYQISFRDLLNGDVDPSRMVVPNATNTRTRYTAELRPEFLHKYDFVGMIRVLQNFNQSHKELFEVDRKTLYKTFYIPKRSGGMRQINAPLPELMDALRQLKRIFEDRMFAMYHTSAFAYVKGRCTVDSIKRHQQNESKWFAKFDFSDFFGSSTPEFVMSMFSQIFPFSEIVKSEEGREALEKALSLCFLNGGLPQGTPISPIITNVMMIPIDHQICNELKKRHERYVYTRYADDILISSKINFDWKDLQNYLVETLKKFDAPFSLNTKKTRYGSSSGSNWNLGVMLNKDNEITIGHQRKKHFKAMICGYICDKKNDVQWELHDVQVLQGLISYYKMIEEKYIKHVIQQHNEKFGVDVEAMLKADIS